MKTRAAPKQSPDIRPIDPAAIPWLIAALTMVTLPHLPDLPLWVIGLVLGVVTARLVSLRFPRLRPGRFLILLLTLGSLAAIKLHYSTIFGRTAGISLLIIMLFLKLLETRTYRDGMVTVIMTYFLIITYFLNTQSIPAAGYMLFAIATTTLALISLNQGPAGVPWQDKLRITLPLIVYSLPLMALLFLLFPRIPGPLWGLPEDSYSAKTGLSEEMTPGQISELAFSDDVAFRVKFHGTPPAPHQLYWRAIIFWDYDGRTWRPGRGGFRTSIRGAAEEYSVEGRPFEYTVTLEPHQQRWLFALDVPVLDDYTRNPGTYTMRLDGSLQLQSSQPIITLSQYRLRSYPKYQLGKQLSPENRLRALQLPEDNNPRSIALAKQWREQNQEPGKIITEVLRLFNREFTYTLRPPLLGSHSIDEFIFNTKRGFCEHFAGSFVFLMRAAGIPARVVTGYQGGETNPIGEYMLVRQADAHAWTEVWLDEEGWVRIDPTNAVSPARIIRGLDASLPARENPRFLLRHKSAAFAKLGLVWDSVNNRWNQWVLGYGPEMQKLFLSQLGFRNMKAHNLVLLLTAALTITILIIAAISLKRIRRRHHDKVQRLYLRLCQKLAKAGYPRQPYEGPADYLQRIRQKHPRLGEELSPALQAYIALRYGPEERQTDDIRSFKILLKHLNGRGIPAFRTPDKKASTASNTPARQYFRLKNRL
jgi:transglutaminase-like putative cysteine protease